MLSTRRPSRNRVVCGFAVVAVVGLSGLGLTASDSPAARSGAVAPVAQAPSVQAGTLHCNQGTQSAKRFTVGAAGSRIREITLCDMDDQRDLAATARNLAAGIEAAADAPPLSETAQFAMLLTLGKMRARIDADTNLSAAERARRAGAVDQAIGALDDEIARSPRLD